MGVGSKKVVILRMDGDWLQIVGTAVNPKDLWEQEITEKDFEDQEGIRLRVDIETVCILVDERLPDDNKAGVLSAPNIG